MLLTSARGYAQTQTSGELGPPGAAIAPTTEQAPAAESVAVGGEGGAEGESDGEPGPSRRRSVSWDPRFGGSLALAQSAGWISGYLTRPVQGLLVETGIAFEPELTVGELRLRAPLAIRVRNVFFDHLPELRGEGGGELRWRPSSRLRVTAEGDVRGVSRPGWADRYQPLGDGTLTPTDRYSHWRARAQLEIAGIPIRHHHARAQYRYELVEYQPDPSFDPYLHATHLVPRNAVQHTGRVTWHVLEHDVRFGGELEAFHRQYLFAFARDRGTGLTHAGPGGAPPNPLEALVGVFPSLDFRIDLDDDRVRIDLRYRHEVVIDLYQGYRSQHGPDGRLRLRWRPIRELTLSNSTGLVYRTYYDGGYAQSANHPLPLDDGTDRYDLRFVEGVEARIRLRAHLYLSLSYDFALRRTNFPDYQPNVFPVARAYAIDWDYQNHRALLTISYDATF